METTTSAPVSTTNYAGFGQRLLALIIDGIILSVAYFVVLTPVIAMMGIGAASAIEGGETMSEEEAIGMVGAIFAGIGIVFLIIIAIYLFYFAGMESSKYQGTVGKMVMGIKVTDLSGNKVSFGKALVRYIGRYLSGMFFCIGYIIAAFTDKKQALHDMIAGTLVLKK